MCYRHLLPLGPNTIQFLIKTFHMYTEAKYFPVITWSEANLVLQPTYLEDEEM